jgi:hypothetical protein
MCISLTHTCTFRLNLHLHRELHMVLDLHVHINTYLHISCQAEHCQDVLEDAFMPALFKAPRRREGWTDRTKAGFSRGLNHCETLRFKLL